MKKFELKDEELFRDKIGLWVADSERNLGERRARYVDVTVSGRPE